MGLCVNFGAIANKLTFFDTFRFGIETAQSGNKEQSPWFFHGGVLGGYRFYTDKERINNVRHEDLETVKEVSSTYPVDGFLGSTIPVRPQNDLAPYWAHAQATL